MTLTSLTGALEESIFATDRLLWWVGDSVDGDRDAERCGVAKFHQIQLCGAKIAGL